MFSGSGGGESNQYCRLVEVHRLAGTQGGHYLQYLQLVVNLTSPRNFRLVGQDIGSGSLKIRRRRHRFRNLWAKFQNIAEKLKNFQKINNKYKYKTIDFGCFETFSRYPS